MHAHTSTHVRFPPLESERHTEAVPPTDIEFGRELRRRRRVADLAAFLELPACLVDDALRTVAEDEDLVARAHRGAA